MSGALKLDTNRADLLVLRASARHALGRKTEARNDIDTALRILPNYPEALVERPRSRRIAGSLGSLKVRLRDTLKSSWKK